VKLLSDPVVSVVIPTYHRPHLIQRSVISVLRQTFEAIEVLVIIDGTDDGTRAVVEGLGDPRTRVIETGQNKGPAAARNCGIAQARGKYIALLDDDDEWTADKLTVQLKRVDELRLTGDFLVASRGMMADRSDVHPHDLLGPNEDISEYLLDRRLFRRNGISAGTLLFPRSLALRVPFPNSSVMEDYGWLLLCVAGERTPVYMCPEAMMIYHMSPASRNTSVNWRVGLDWIKQYRSHISGTAVAGFLSSATARRAKQQGDYRAFSEIARVMRSEGKPRLSHWLMLLTVAIVPSNLTDLLRQLRLKTPRG
jgi:hypothetical protein